MKNNLRIWLIAESGQPAIPTYYQHLDYVHITFDVADFIANKLHLWKLCRGCLNDIPFLIDANNAGRLFYPMDPI